MAICSGFPVLAAIGLASCAPAPKPAPPPATVIPPTPEAEAPAIDWRDLPLSPGGWTYLPAGPTAQFSRPGMAPDFTIGCDKKMKAVVLFRAGKSEGPLTITTSYSGLTFPAQSASDGVSIRLAATNDFLDRIAFSRGRFTVAAPGLPTLVLPAWAEPARVIEDCRS